MANSLDANPGQVLVVEDESEIRELISLLLLRQGHRVQQCSSALEGLDQLRRNNFDLIVLDWMLPQMSGIEFLKQIAGMKIPVLMVTAKTEPADIVQGLEAGADDYITKPFETSVLTARVKALLRRTQKAQASEATKSQLKVGGIAMNMDTYEVLLKGEQIHLTPSEFKILSEMILNQGRVLTRDQLIETVQGEGISVTGRTIDTHVFGLRKKLDTEADWIETIRGVGYRVRAE
jgi:DNA-binding response OmpR family regulator